MGNPRARRRVSLCWPSASSSGCSRDDEKGCHSPCLALRSAPSASYSGGLYLEPFRRGSLTRTKHTRFPPVLFEACLARAGLPGEIGRSQRRRWRILSLRSAAESHGQRSASPSLEGLPRRLHALSQSPQQPRWPRCINLLLSPAQGESWRSFSCFVPTSSASHLRWNMIVSHEQAHLLCRVRDELMQRCRLSSMPSSLTGVLDGFSERP